MSNRIALGKTLPNLMKQLVELSASVNKAAADAGVDQSLLELVKIRASQINGCAFCLDMHVRDARKAGETEQRIYLLNAWREVTGVYTEQERAALALTEAMTKLPDTQDVPDDVYAEATRVFTEEQYTVTAWAITVINALNRISVTSRNPVPGTR
ncbi:carboxymuconolactone decarboxylase family protein [Amycolatopsis pigmentata]|uniref:Carboxymuconolactone decarboxylase family protein n=1 Tax=Amycolatopsis pigmentata TaxID=450801 RepID=A0ABW5G159_9PSEU